MSITLYAGVKFDRAIRKKTDLVSPGGYEIGFRPARDRVIPSMRFDFCDTEAWIDEDDPCLLWYQQKTLDEVSFPESSRLNRFALIDTDSVIEWYIDTDTNDGSEPLRPMKLIHAEFNAGADWNVEFGEKLLKEASASMNGGGLYA